MDDLPYSLQIQSGPRKGKAKTSIPWVEITRVKHLPQVSVIMRERERVTHENEWGEEYKRYVDPPTLPARFAALGSCFEYARGGVICAREGTAFYQNNRPRMVVASGC